MTMFLVQKKAVGSGSRTASYLGHLAAPYGDLSLFVSYTAALSGIPR